jgi:hypothetical protein
MVQSGSDDSQKDYAVPDSVYYHVIQVACGEIKAIPNYKDPYTDAKALWSSSR